MARWGCSGSSGGSGSAVRTVCVRTCDGYYFPISNSANRKRLKIDEAVCHAMYPGGGAELYTQRYGGDTEADMKSLSGEEYSSQPFAYRYRTVYDPGCAGELQRRPSSPAIAATPVSPLPDASSVTSADVTTFEAPEERATRIVGPADFYTLPDSSEPTAASPPSHAQLFSGVPRFAAAFAPLASQ